MKKLHYTHCPVCNSTSIHSLMPVKDHSVSREEFVIWQCGACSLRFTQDAPDERFIGPYYQSPDYISHTNTSKGLLNKLYQKVRSMTLRQKASLVIKKTTSKGNLLDIGSGTGAFPHQMKNMGWDVTGIEPDEGARSLSERLYGMVLLQPSVMEDLPRESFDAITLWHVLEHVQPLHVYMQTLRSLLKTGGKIFIAVPNYLSGDAEAYQAAWAAYDVPRHLYHFSAQSMDVLVRQHGLRILEKKPMWFDAFYISLLSSKYRNGSTSWMGAGIQGIRSNLKALFKKEKASSVIYIIERV